jgi:hypothetical protein
VIAEVRTELRLAWRSFVLPALLILCALIAVLNVANTAQLVRSDYSLLQHTRAEYAANHLDFAADLRKPVVVTTHGGQQSITNLARYDYDTMATAATAMSPASTMTESLKYFGFLIFPAIFFLLGLWMSTSQRRHHLEKATLVRAGTARTMAARQLALVASGVVVIAVVEFADVIARAITQAVLSAHIPLAAFAPLSPAPAQNPWAQWGVILLVVLFFGWGGITVGAFAGVFAIPGLAFLVWDYVVPIFAAHDPRNWFAVLGHSVFRYDTGFQLTAAIPLGVPFALVAVFVATVLLGAIGYLGIRIRNPLAT